MIKLSKVQIEALASKIISDIKRPVIEYNKSIENSDEYKLFFENEIKDKNNQKKYMDKKKHKNIIQK